MADQEIVPPDTPAVAAADYLLGSPDFAAPVLTQSHQLSAAEYLVAPLTFSAPPWGLFMGPARVTVTWNPQGRPRHIPDDVKDRMIAAVAAQLPAMQEAMPSSRRLVQEDRVVMDFVRALAQNEKVTTSSRTLLEQVVSPAFQKWRVKP
ncbi:MAG TPA: hypothetical protein VKG24_31970 [Pseudolabrys sp.]|nr:hypothetical protein [Pseudolabrys sp.]